MFSTHRDFQVCEGDSYSCKWFSPLSKVEAVETDYHHDIWDYIVARGQRSNNDANLFMFKSYECLPLLVYTTLQNGVGGWEVGGEEDRVWSSERIHRLWST